jgi:hypothetical protein
MSPNATSNRSTPFSRRCRFLTICGSNIPGPIAWHLDLHVPGRLGQHLVQECLVAMLLHELGHRATRATRFALVTLWLAAPWRFASPLVIGIGLATVGRRQPPRLLVLVVAAAVVVAVVWAVQQRRWGVAAVLSAVAACAVACPLADAAVSRRSEYTVDRCVLQLVSDPSLPLRCR